MTNVDYIEDIDAESAMSTMEREHKGSPAVFGFSSSLSATTADGVAKRIDSTEFDKSATFFQNYKYWNQTTCFVSTNNTNNSYFNEIVNMGADAVPFIIEELKKGPTPLVYALDKIFPDVIHYEGFVSLKDACDKWLSILQ